MRKLSGRDRILLTAWLAGLVLLALVIGVARPMHARWRGLKKDIATLRQSIAVATAMYRETPAVETEVAELAQIVSTLSRPADEVGPAMIREIDRLTGELGVQLLTLRPGDVEDLDVCRKHTAVFEVESDFPRIVRLLYRLERPPLRLWVEGVDLTSDRTPENKVRAKISVAAYTVETSAEERP